VQSGTLSPGSSPGTLTINDDLTLNSGAMLDMEFGAANVPGGR
jgi:fibronectin-binding autotransporter adhesin